MASQEPNKPIMLSGPAPQAPALADSAFSRSGYYVNGALVAADGSGAQPGTQGAVTFAGLHRAFKRCWPLALGVAAAGAALAVGAVLLLMPLQYRASARFLVSAGGAAPVMEGAREHVDFAVVKSNQMSLVKGPSVLKAALQQKTAGGKEVRDLAIVRAHDDPISWMEGAIKVDFPSAEIMRISLPGDQADEVAELVNAVAKGLLQVNQERELAEREKLIEELEKKLRDLEQGLGIKRVQWDTRAKAHDTKAREEAFKLAQDMVKDAKTVLRKNEWDLQTAKEHLAELNTKIKMIDTLPAPLDKLDDYLRLDPRGASLYLILKKTQEDLIETPRVVKPSVAKPIIERLERDRKAVLKSIAELRDQLRPELEAQYRLAELSRLHGQVLEQEGKIRTYDRLGAIFAAEVTKAEAEAKKAAPSSAPLPPDLQNLRDNIKSDEIVRDRVATAIGTLRAHADRPRVQVQSWANEPSGKDASRQIKFAGAGASVFFVLLLFGVTYFEFRSGKVGAADEIAQSGINLVGTIPNLPARARQGAADAAQADPYWQNQLGESVDSIRTLLLHVSRTDSLRVLMVTSAVGGEGKTSLASQLAASLARAWRKTLLIDGDLRHPAGHALFGLPLEPGFSEVLRGEVKPADAIKPTALSRLWLMPAGHWDSHAVQALAQENVRSLLEQLKQQYDFIIVDSCPVLPVADSLVLGQHVDGVVFSVLRDVSRLPALHAAHQKMTSLGIRTLGAVVIGAKDEAGAAGYKYTAGRTT